MQWKRHAPVMVAAALVIVVQVACTWCLVHEGRRNYAANVVETFKACAGTWNPWEKYPWDK